MKFLKMVGLWFALIINFSVFLVASIVIANSMVLLFDGRTFWEGFLWITGSSVVLALNLSLFPFLKEKLSDIF